MEKKSTHRVEVVELNLEKHPHADSLSIQKVYGYQVVLRTEDWAGKKYGAYIVPDSVVDTERPEFAWLAPPVREIIDGKEVLTGGNSNFRPAGGDTDTRYHRVTTMRLRKVISFGLMVEAPAGFSPGDDVSDYLGVTRYQPVLITEGQALPPAGFHADYDIEAFERYGQEMFQEGDEVIGFEKLDGVSSRYCCDEENVVHVGSKSIWLEKNDNSTWWKVLKKYPGIEVMCKETIATMYGEIIGFTGQNHKYRYGLKPGEIDFYLFDVLIGSEFLSHSDLVSFAKDAKVKLVPFIAQMPFNMAKAMELANGPSLVLGSNHHREGIVWRHVHEKRTLSGRCVLKLVSANAY